MSGLKHGEDVEEIAMLPEAEFVAALQFRLVGRRAGDAAEESRKLARGAERGVIFFPQGEHLLPFLGGNRG